MASAKPVALSTNFLRAVRSCKPQTYPSIRSPPHSRHRQQIHTTSRHLQQEAGYQRYGPAASQNIPPPSMPAEVHLPSTEQAKKDASDVERKQDEQRERSEKQSQDDSKRATPAPETEIKATESKQSGSSPDQKSTEKSSGASTSSSSEPLPTPEDDKPLPNRELDMVLSIPTPNELKGNSGDSSHHRHPHIETPPYEHHFDTYSLVQELANKTDADHEVFTEMQSVTLMKAIRQMLSENLDIAKEGLVSKSDNENETYLFRAACSELKTTMQTSRFMEAQKQRSQRAQLQHEFDILNQKVNQDILNMREELKAMFNDRKLGLQEEKRRVDGKIQDLTYQINVDLNSEAKSEAEGLRWVLTRRAALAIGAAASMVLGFLQYYGAKTREQAELEKKRKVAAKAQEESMARDQARFTTPARSAGTQTAATGADTDYAESLG